MRLIGLVFALAGCTGALKTTGFSSSSSSTNPSGNSDSGGGSFSGNNDVTVPDLTGKTEEEAIAAVRAAGFRSAAEPTPLSCYDAPEVEGQVNCQSPEPGKTVKAYTMVQFNVYKKQRIAGAVVRDQLAALIGKTPDAARKLLDSYGHDGRVKVEPAGTFQEGCAEGVVCSFSVPESGMGIHDSITLYTQTKLSISGPPPE